MAPGSRLKSNRNIDGAGHKPAPFHFGSGTFSRLCRVNVTARTSVLSTHEREDLFDAYLKRCRWIRVYFAWRPNSPDESDKHLIELAVAVGAEVLVTRNLRDLRVDASPKNAS
ncbi:MAG: PIN domain-containing protein [Betaproteobacteria bacterium]|nr:PIN domain-containing protein [Betaproteobacteria bacterium]